MIVIKVGYNVINRIFRKSNFAYQEDLECFWECKKQIPFYEEEWFVAYQTYYNDYDSSLHED